MTEYIEREALKILFAGACAECRDSCAEFDGIEADCNQCLLNGVIKDAKSIPTADVRPVVRKPVVGYDGGKLMYDELVKELRYSAEWAGHLALLMGRAEGDTHAPIMRKAADVIEELQKRVPKRPHGRLIDADALRAKQQEDADLFQGSTAYCDKCRRDEAMNAVANIVNAPTVIEAEEGE